jgi:aspartate kinase
MYATAGDRPIVQKYGGTSVGSVERIRNIARRVAAQVAEGRKKIAIVVSAMSGETNRLVELVMQANPDATGRNYDMAIAAGEQVSVALMAAALEREGVAAKGFLAYQLGIYTDNFHAKARIKSINTASLFECWEKGEIPVIAGFQGVNEYNDITTLGRGGSDTSAVAIAVALNAAFCEINTDVDGMFTADPRVVQNAKLLSFQDFEVALEMASLGSKVLHSRCVELGAKYKMPLTVRNTFKPDDHDRTVIMSFTEKQRLEAPVVSGITVDKKVARITLDGLPTDNAFMADVFKKIAELGVNVDVIVHNKLNDESGFRLGFTLHEDEAEKTVKSLSAWTESQAAGKGIQICAEGKLAKVSAVGLGMQSHPGVASKCFEVLVANNIAIKMVSTSEIKISCVVDSSVADEAARVLHDAFIID